MSSFDAYIRLDGTLKGSIACDESMVRHTTYHIGGPAALFIECSTLGDLSLATEVLTEEEVEWTVVGKGSNLLVADEGYPGAILTLGGEFAHQDFGGFDASAAVHAADEEVIITAGAGTVLSRLVQKAFGSGLSGFEFEVGVPGTLGGALFMNAGSRDKWIGSIVDTITTFVPGKGLVRRHGSELVWSYRCGGIPAGEIIVEAALRTKTADAMMMRAQMEAARKRRSASQPLNKPSCGSVFRNPQGDSAGRLIESCGLKGKVCGGAQISEKHANFIVNLGSAKAVDVLELIHDAHDRVKETHGIELRPEVRFLGFPV